MAVPADAAVLVGLGSELDLPVVEQAAQEAAGHGRPLHLLHTFDWQRGLRRGHRRRTPRPGRRTDHPGRPTRPPDRARADRPRGDRRERHAAHPHPPLGGHLPAGRRRQRHGRQRPVRSGRDAPPCSWPHAPAARCWWSAASRRRRARCWSAWTARPAHTSPSQWAVRVRGPPGRPTAGAAGGRVRRGHRRGRRAAHARHWPGTPAATPRCRPSAASYAATPPRC